MKLSLPEYFHQIGTQLFRFFFVNRDFQSMRSLNSSQLLNATMCSLPSQYEN